MTISRLVLAAVSVSSALGGTPMRAGGQEGSVVLTPCTIAGLGGDVRCGTVPVPENRARPAGRRILLRVAVARSTDTAARRPDPLVLLAGGPGQAGTEMGAFANDAFGAVRRTRDLLLFDQRGTGASNSLACRIYRTPRDFGDPMYPEASVSFCRDSLRTIADLTQYTSEASADDIEDLRKALGYPALNFYGTSYGTRLALAYLQRHPRGARAVVLKAVAPNLMNAPMSYAEDGERALGLLVRDCDANAACREAMPDIRGDLAAVLARADSGRIVALLARPGGGADSVPLQRGAVAGAVLASMQSASSRAQIPAVLRRAAAGDASVLTNAVLQWRRQLDQMIAIGMHLSVLCSDDGTRLDAAAARATNSSTFLGDSRVSASINACRAWVPFPRTPATPVRSSVPVLLVSGELDPNTPPRWAELTSRSLSNSRHVVLAGVAHAWNNVVECGSAFVAQFVETASHANLDLSCASRAPAPNFLMPR